MKTLMRVVLAGLIYVSLLVGIANANVHCFYDKERIYKDLEKNYNEFIIASATVSDGRYLEVLVSRQGTYTIVVTEINNKSCVVSVGENWEFFVPEERVKGILN